MGPKNLEILNLFLFDFSSCLQFKWQMSASKVIGAYIS